MKAKNLMKGLLTICVLFVGLSLNATLGEISVSGFITSDEGEPLSETTITCSGSQIALIKKLPNYDREVLQIVYRLLL